MKNRISRIRTLVSRLLNLARITEDPVLLIKYVPGRLAGERLECTRPSRISSDSLPVPPRELWLGYGSTEQEYLDSGRTDTERMVAILAEAGYSVGASDLPILDLGCGGGRMIRHLHEIARTVDVWGIDISAPHIAWLKTNLTPPFRFATGTTIPHLPFEDGSLGLVYCGSVFTHIDDFAESWFLEIRRVLAPGGVLYCTLHDEHTRAILIGEPNHPVARSLRGNTYLNPQIDPPDILVIGQSHDSNVFYHSRYLRKFLDGMFDISSVTPRAYGYQSAWILTKA
jgi:SAM-dependent methyltransferase